MKYFFTFIIALITFTSYSQGYEEVKENEPFRKANMIIIECDSIPSNAFQIIGKTLVKYNFTIKEVFKEYGSITTNFNNGYLIQWQCYVIIVDNEIRIQGKYNSMLPLGMQTGMTILAGKDYTQTQGITLDFRNDLEDYYNEMTEIASVIKEKVNGKKLFHVERGKVTKY